jgi:hypothetical protein
MSTKSRTTLSLSKEAVHFLNRYRREQHLGSMSATVEDLVRLVRHEAERKAVEANMVAYYDALPNEELEAEASLGQAGAQALANQMDQEEHERQREPEAILA